MTNTPPPPGGQGPTPHKRRPRYAGKYPRRFEEKYKELAPSRHAATLAKVIASGKTPAGTHRPIMVPEVLDVLSPKPGEVALDCTLGYGGHAQAILPRLLPGGRLLGLDSDPIELPRAARRLQALGFGPDVFTAHRTNFAGLGRALASAGFTQVDIVLADLGVSSMQLDNPARGFSAKFEGPLDLRMNPQRGEPANALLKKITSSRLETLLVEGADEPCAAQLAAALAGMDLPTTKALKLAVERTLPRLDPDQRALAVRRVFQSLRIAVNDEFSALESLLRNLPGCLKHGGRVAILSFHSGEDRRVKRAFEAGLLAGIYADISREVLRPVPEEQRSNPRSASAKLRWARKAGSA